MNPVQDGGPLNAWSSGVTLGGSRGAVLAGIRLRSASGVEHQERLPPLPRCPDNHAFHGVQREVTIAAIETSVESGGPWDMRSSKSSSRTSKCGRNRVEQRLFVDRFEQYCNWMCLLDETSRCGIVSVCESV